MIPTLYELEIIVTFSCRCFGKRLSVIAFHFWRFERHYAIMQHPPKSSRIMHFYVVLLLAVLPLAITDPLPRENLNQLQDEFSSLGPDSIDDSIYHGFSDIVGDQVLGSPTSLALENSNSQAKPENGENECSPDGPKSAPGAEPGKSCANVRQEKPCENKNAHLCCRGPIGQWSVFSLITWVENCVRCEILFSSVSMHLL